MKQVFVIILSIILFSNSFAQEEIWGYNSLMGSEGGGLIYKIDPKLGVTQPIHRFDYSKGYYGQIDYHSATDSVSKIYMHVRLYEGPNSYPDSYFSEYDVNSQEIKFLVKSNCLHTYTYVNSNDVFWIDNGFGNDFDYIKHYDISSEEIVNSIDVDDETTGDVIQTPWLYKDGKYFLLAKHGTSNDQGSLLSYNPNSHEFKKEFEFTDIYHPVGCLFENDNGEMIGVTQKGGENDLGAIFKIGSDSEPYDVMHHFSNETGGEPIEAAVKDNDGNIYGLTQNGGEYNNGTIYKYNLNNNTLETVFHFDPDADYMNEYYVYPRSLSFDGGRKIYFNIAEVFNTLSDGFLVSFDIIDEELQIEYEFKNDNFRDPRGSIHILNGMVYGTAKDIYMPDYHYQGGLYKFNPEDKTASVEKVLRDFEEEENGSQPNWMCQGGDGNVYGLTRKGGKNNQGIAFEIDEYNHSFSKLFDLSDLEAGFSSDFKSFAFQMDSTHIIGLCLNWYDEDYVFDFDISSKTISKRFVFPSEIKIGYNTKFKMGFDKNIYFLSSKKLYTYSYINNEITQINLPNDISLSGIYESEPGIYYGVTAEDIGEGEHSMFKWNSETDEIDIILNGNDMAGNDDFLNYVDLLITENNTLIGSYFGYCCSGEGDEYRIFTYDIENEQFINTEKYYYGFDRIDFDNYKTHRLYNYADSNLLISSTLFYIKTLDLDNYEVNRINVENSIFYYDFQPGHGSGYIISHAPFDISPATDIIIVKTPNVGIDDIPINETDVKIYYGSNKLYISSDKQIDRASFSVFNTLGQLVLNTEASNFIEIELEVDLPTGPYIVQLRSNKMVRNQKVMIR